MYIFIIIGSVSLKFGKTAAVSIESRCEKTTVEKIANVAPVHPNCLPRYLICHSNNKFGLNTVKWDAKEETGGNLPKAERDNGAFVIRRGNIHRFLGMVLIFIGRWGDI